ncbi:hypothetical protein [Halorarius halobius]|uniref:hypothetical protein n=1 Tax=Halorarius halobius TaxID=2962671 RepID=UPI0020CB81B6|nr:hypothetical protein [Halorarius halobius]
MTATEGGTASPVELAARSVRSLWNTLLTVYYANSLSWRALKSGALLFFGFFLWAGSNVVRSYFPDLWFLRFTASYGFVLVVYGPFHHLVVIPVYQRLRRQGRHLSLGSHLHLPNASLAVFLALVVLLGTFPIAPMTIDFRSSLGDGGPDITPDLTCVKGTAGNGTTTVHCHLTESAGVDRVVVESGDRRLTVDEEPPYEFTVLADDMQAVTGTKRFRVDLLAEDGTLVRRFTRSLPMIDEG